MSSRGGRDRPRRDRSEEKNNNHGRTNAAPPSRHLWIGNLSHTLTERALSNQFREFGELESVAFQPGRSYAFVNFIDDNAAFAAYEALQGFILAGNALRIEFTKGEKSSSSSASKHDEHYSRPRDESRSSLRGSRTPRHTSSEPVHHNRNNSKPDGEQPSEVLWVGFPQSMKVDEDSLWNAFAPFGEIEKISVFPGRTFAFVRYKHVSSASRAINNLQGKLFNNPRVHISFAKSDSGPSSGPSNSSKNLINDHPPTPRGRRYHDARRSPRYMEPDDGIGFDRKRNRSVGRNVPFEPPRFHDIGHDLGNIYGRNSPIRDRMGSGLLNYPPQSFRHQGPLYDDEWDLPEDALVYHKKPKSNLMPPPEPELPEYPFIESEQVKHVLPRAPEFSLSRHGMIDNNLGGHFGHHKQPYGFQTGSVLSTQNPVEWKRPTPEPATGEWKWEGIIAKGGTSICRARCFPVGKVLDMNLPEFLDCTARTNLDVLAKHFYRAARSWVVFFVPESDADIGFYNEFMNYLGEKERAAVAKLDDKTTLFLVPPSDFSEKVLKVPGKLSISGVILRLDSSSSSSIVEPPLPPPPPPPQPLERHEPYLVSSHGEVPRTPFSSYPSVQPFSNHGNVRLPPGPVPFRNMVENTQDHLHHHHHHHQQQNLINMAPPSRGGGGGGGGDFMIPPSNDPVGSSSYRPGSPAVIPQYDSVGSSSYRPGSPAIMPQYGQQAAGGSGGGGGGGGGGGVQDQLAQLASYLGNSRQSTTGIPTGEDFRQSANANVYGMPQTLSLQTGSDHHPASSQYHHVQMQHFQQQQVSNLAPVAQTGQVNVHEEADADPQKRLQATLELAATLLKQIQQGKT